LRRAPISPEVRHNWVQWKKHSPVLTHGDEAATDRWLDSMSYGDLIIRELGLTKDVFRLSDPIAATGDYGVSSDVISAYADEHGKLLAFDAKAAVDSGAYSAYPFTSAIEPSQVAAILPGPYVIPVYRCRATAVVTNKCPQLPYRGVARPNVCYAMELMLDAIARQIGREPYEVRLANLVRPEQMPFDNVTDKHFDSGDYPEILRKAVDAIGVPAIRARQQRGESDGRLIGLGISIFSEQTAHGTTADGKRRALYEQVFARLTARSPGRNPKHRART
jgi:CO/xanthine dehydrogenase Mo-binding subunit